MGVRTENPYCSACGRRRLVVAYEMGGGAKLAARLKDGKIDRLLRSGRAGEPTSLLACSRCDHTSDWPRFAGTS